MARAKFVPLATFEQKCANCGKVNTECVGFKKTTMFIFKSEQYICQTCISKAFRSFKKGK